MGACGCGDYAASYRLPGPPGITYAIEVYYGCPDCDTGLAVCIYRHGPDGVRDWRVDELPDFPFDNYGASPEGEGWLPLLGPKELCAAVCSLLNLDEDLSAEVECEANTLIRDAVEATRADALAGGVTEPRPSVLDRAAAVLLAAPLPTAEPDRNREVVRRAEEVARMLSADAPTGGGEEPR